jgi:hypothetical protein
MNPVKLFGLLPIEVDHLQRPDRQPGRLEPPDDISQMTTANRVRLHHHQRAL